MGGDSARASTLRVDTAPPAIHSIAAPKGQTYGEGGTIAFRVNFTESVTATGVPTLPITIGDNVRQAAWNGRGSGSKSLTFTLPVRAGDSAPTGVRVAGPIVLSDDAAIRDKAGNDLIPAASGEFPRARVDAVGPSLSDFGRIAIAGKRVSMRVTFTEPVTVRGKPSVSFTLDGAPSQLVYASGSGSNVLTFEYRAENRETLTADKITVSNSVITNGVSRITDRFGNVSASLAQPTDIGLSITSLPENEPSGRVVGILSTVDTDGTRDRHTFTLVSGEGAGDNTSFSITSRELKTATGFDFETKNPYFIRLRSTDSGGLFTEKTFVVTVTDVNDFAPVFTSGPTGSVAENAPISTAICTAATTDADGTLANRAVTYSIKPGVGDAALVQIDATTGVVTLLASANFEAKPSYAFTVVATNAGTGATLVTEQAVAVTVTDVNEAPTGVVLTNTTSSLPENTSTATRIKVADIVVADDALGTTSITLTGADAARFELDGLALYLKSGVSLDYEAKALYAVAVNVTDTLLPGSTPAAVNFTCTVTDANETPTTITLSATSIAENAGANAEVGTFTTTDPDAANNFTYSLVAGAGSTDNASFNISGNQLRATASLDFETQSSYSVRVRSTDQGGLFTEKTFAITVTNANDSPIDIALSASTIAENAGTNAVVGMFTTTDLDVGNTFVYTLVAGTGSNDNASFNISGNHLRATASLDFETQSSYSVRVRSTDQGSLSFEKTFTITVTDVNEAPTVVSLANTTPTISENTSTASQIKVADILVTDDALGTNTITLSGADSGSFEVDGLALFLKSAVTLDFETKQSHAVTLSVADASVAGSTPVSVTFTLTVTNANETPTDITLSASTIAENAGGNAVVGTFATTDPDAANTFTYTLVTGTGSTDNGSFNMSGNQLRATASLDFEAQSSYSVRVRSTDQGGLFTEKQFTISAIDIVEMAFVTVGDSGNSADPATGNLYGAVNYQYQIGTYEVTIGQYTAFLNAVAADDPYGLYSPTMATDLTIAGISRTGPPGSYTYSVIAPAGATPARADSPGNRPITLVSWFDAARFANWMHNGQGSGSTETGAYTISTGVITAASRTSNVNTYTLAAPSTLSVGDQVRVTGLLGSGFNIPGIVTSVSGSQFTMSRSGTDATASGTGTMTGASPTAAFGALYRLPTENEWYKAAYYSPNLNSGSGGYYAYATQSNTAPGNTIGNGANQANYYAGDYTVTQLTSFSSSQNYLTNVGAFTNSSSYYGTYDQSGNVWEWSEVIPSSGSSRVLRGGDFADTNAGASNLSSSFGIAIDPSFGGSTIGFRLARTG